MQYMARSCQYGWTMSVFGDTHGMHICCRHDRMQMEVRRPPRSARSLAFRRSVCCSTARYPCDSTEMRMETSG